MEADVANAAPKRFKWQNRAMEEENECDREASQYVDVQKTTTGSQLWKQRGRCHYGTYGDQKSIRAPADQGH
jgi:hypothetical protein